MILGTYGHGGDVYRNQVDYDFSANVNPLGTPKAVIKAIQEAALHLSRYPDPYCDRLREKLARTLQVPSAQLLCGNGAAELIFHFVQAVRPKRTLLPVPSFSEYEAALSALDCQVDYFPLLREEGFRLNESILQSITRETEALVLCNPNNPTGLLIEKDLMEQILDRCRKMGTYLLLDECFVDLTDEELAYSVLPLLREGDRVFVLRAFTKLYGMAGVRLGYGISPDPALLAAMCRFQQPWNVSTLAQAAGCAALDCGDFVTETRASLRRERAFLEAGLRELGIDYLSGKANYLMFSGRADWGQRLLEKGILIRSCANYRGLGPNDYRIAVRMREENQLLLQALKKLKKGESL